MDTPRQETSPNRHSHSHHHDRHERQGQVVSPTRLTQRAASTNEAPSTSPLPTQGTYSLLSHLREQAPTIHPTPEPYTHNIIILPQKTITFVSYIRSATNPTGTHCTHSKAHSTHSTAGDHDRNYTDSTLDARPTPHTTRGSGRCPAALHATTSLALIFFSCHVSCRAVRPTERACSTQEPANTPARSETLQSSYSSSYPPRHPPARLLGDVQPQLLLAVLEVRTLGRTHGRPDASAARDTTCC